MKNVFVLILSIFVNLIFSQSYLPILDTSLIKPTKGVKEYYENVRLAENAIVKNDTILAINYYMEAFKYKRPFMRDYLNAKFLYSSKPIVDSIILLKLYQISRSNSEIDRNYDEYIDKLVQERPELNTTFIKSWKRERTIQKFPINIKLDTNLRNEIIGMFELEQKLRLSGKKFTDIDSSNLYKIINLYKKYDDISEQTIGDAMEWINLMLFHASRYKMPEWIPIIGNQVMKGNFPNKWYARLIDSYIKWNVSPEKNASYFYYDSGYPLYSKYLLLKESDMLFLENVNKRRFKFFMDSWEEQQQKQLWNFRHQFRISFYSFFNYVISASPNDTPIQIELGEKKQTDFINDFKLKNGENSFIIYSNDSQDYEIMNKMK